MSPPRTIIYDLPQDRYGRVTRLTGTVEAGQVYWEIRSYPANQRDDGAVIRSLTTEQLVSLGEEVAHYLTTVRK